ILLKSLQAWNDSTAPLVREGDRRARIGDYKGAIDSYTLGLQVEESTRTRYRRAYCLALIKKYDLAIEDCTLNLTADPKHYESQAMRAWCQVKAGKFSEATSDYETLIAAQPNDARHAYALGSLQVYAKDDSTATKRRATD